MADSIINPMTSPVVDNTQNVRTTNSNNSTTLDETAFLNLFVEALKNQDPLEPMSNGEMMQQLTQLTQIQNTMNMKTILEDLASSIQGQNPIGDYLDLIGKKVKVETDTGYKEGEVLSVGKNGNDIVFEFEDGEAYYVNQIIGATEN